MKELEYYVKNISKDYQLKKVNKNLLLTNYEINILKKYNISYNTCNSYNEILYLIDIILNNDYLKDLEDISISISERNYYQNTNK